MTALIVQVEDLSKRYGELIAVDGVSFDVPQGSTCGTTALRRANKDQALPMHAAEGVLRLLELEAMATDTFESDDAAHGWLRRQHPMLEGECPLEAAKTSFGTRRVKDMLVAIKYGGVV